MQLQKKRKVCVPREADSSTPPSFLDDGGGRDGDGFEYDVFISFRGEDTRKGFTGHLYESLRTKGVSAFLDSEGLEKGKSIDELLTVIQNSEIFVPIFSKGYAESKWCLREIATALNSERLILPLFFNVEPRDVKNQTGAFESAFQKHEKELDGRAVEGWRKALRKDAEISGFELRTETDGHEAKLIKVIVKRILGELNITPLNVATHPIGIKVRVDDMMKVLDIDNDDVRIVGIHGTGGIGKTTIVKAVYNEIYYKFDCSCFIANVGGRSKQAHDGLVKLQMQLIHELFKDDDSTVFDPESGMGTIRRRLHRKRVLIVLDDVDNKDQLQYLAGNKSWFHKGSRVIITTRNESALLQHNVGNHEIYKPKELEPEEALQLFTYHAFGTNNPANGYVDLSKKIVEATGRLPLALEIYGSLFFDASTRGEWEELFDKLKHIQHQDIQKRLKISLEELDEGEKSVFLDIACFFIGKQREDATLMWKSCNYFPYSAIRVLLHRSLVKINEETGEFEMHDLIRDMGRSIIQQECHSNPGKRSRLWNHSEITEVLDNFMGSDAVEAISGDQADKRFLRTKVFHQMPNLRLLQIQLTSFEDDFCHFPSKLKWLELRWCKFDAHYQIEMLSSSSNEPTVNLLLRRVVLRMKFDKLVVLNLSNCEGMVITPNFSGVPNLVKLTLDGCLNLEEVHESIGCLKSLVLLSMRCCGKLQELPACCDQLHALEVLILSFCFAFTTLPEGLGKMKFMRKLMLNHTRIRYLPGSAMELKNLCKLSLAGCSSFKALPNNLGSLNCLEELMVTETAIEEIPESVGDLTKLRVIDAASCNSLRILPDSIVLLRELETLSLDDCIKLEDLPQSIGFLVKLRSLSINGCKNLKALPVSVTMLKNLCTLRMAGTRVRKIPQDVGSFLTLRSLDISDSNSSLPLNLTSLEEIVACKSYLFETSADFKNLTSLKTLKLDGSHIFHLTPSISGFSQLQKLSLDKCRFIESLPQLPPSLVVLSARRCIRLREIPQVSNLKDLRQMDLFLGMNLINIGGLEELKSIEDINLLNCTKLGNAFKHRLLKDELSFECLKSFNISSTLMELGNYNTYFEKPSTLKSPNEDQMFLILPNNHKLLLPDKFDVSIWEKRLLDEPREIIKVAHKCSHDGHGMIWLSSDSVKERVSCYAISFEKKDQLFRYMGVSNYVIDIFPASQGSDTAASPAMDQELKIFHTSNWIGPSTLGYYDRGDMLVMILPNAEDWIVPIQLVMVEVSYADDTNSVMFRTVRAAHRYSDYLHSFLEDPCYVVHLTEKDQLDWHTDDCTLIHITADLGMGPAAPFQHLKWCHASSRFRGLVHRPPVDNFIVDKLSFPVPRAPKDSEVFMKKLILKSSEICAGKLDIPVEVEIENSIILKLTITAIRRQWYVEEKFDECQCKVCSEKEELCYYISTFDRDHEIHKFLGHPNTKFCVPCDFYVPRSADLFLEYSPTT